jgi:hypothetical protein
MDQQEVALREQLQQLARRKEEVKKNDGERAKDQLNDEIPAARMHLLGLLRTADNLGIEIEGEYVTTLHRIVQEAGATGIALSLVQEVLPDQKKLQFAREELGPKGSGEIVEKTAKEHLKEGKGRGLFFVWNEKHSRPTAVDQGGEPPALDSGNEAEAEVEVIPPQRKLGQTAKPTTGTR